MHYFYAQFNISFGFIAVKDENAFLDLTPSVQYEAKTLIYFCKARACSVLI